MQESNIDWVNGFEHIMILHPRYLPDLFLFFFAYSFLSAIPLKAQVNPCSPNTPAYVVDLTGNPSGTWVSSPPIARDGSCCGSTWPDRCIVFLITLDTATVAINFNIASGAMPSGSMFYQIDCGNPVPVGQPICLQGPGPYALSFCKPGNNLNTYAITAIGGPSVSPDDTVGVGCTMTMSASGLNPATVTWTSVFPGSNGAYNSYLNCVTGCSTVVVTPAPGAPTYVDYKVCGQSAAPSCLPNPTFCDTIRVYINPALTADATPDPAVYCSASGGVLLTGNSAGGDGAYTYAWIDQNGNLLGDTANYYVQTTGTFIFQVTDGQYPGCPAKYDTVTVSLQNTPSANAGPDVTMCAGGSVFLSGTITGAVGGVWSGGNGYFFPGNTSLNINYTPTSAEAAAGGVTLTLTSSGSGVCPPATDQVTVFIKPALNATIAGTPIICFGTNATLTAVVSGGTAPYSLIWSTGAVTNSILAGPGSYSVTVTDTSTFQCTATAFFTVTQNPPLSVNVTPGTVINCNLTTTISAFPSGGNGSYTYFWNTGQVTQTISVVPGFYAVTITDGAGCTATGSVTVSGVNSTLTASIQQPSNICFGGTTSIVVTAIGGYGDYNYLWGNGSTLTSITVYAGTYCVTVSDSAGCFTTACTQVNQDPPLSVTISNPSPVCNGVMDTISASATGGQPPYSYVWNTGQVTQTIIQPAGTYSVTVTDGNPDGCTASSSVLIYYAPEISIIMTSNNVTCFNGTNGSAAVIASGGIPGYSYTWLPSGGNAPIASNLGAGNYSAVVEDNIGCIKTGTVTITQPPALLVSISSQTNIDCSGGTNGSAAISVSGGISPYGYQWSPYGGVGPAATGLVAGTYSVSVIDANGCMNSATVTITQPPVLSANLFVTQVTCYGGGNGSAAASPSGGTPAYSYLWSTGSTGAAAGNLLPGSYNVTITDSKGCSVIRNISITEPPPLAASAAQVSSASCYGAADGVASVTASGGTGNYSFSWSNGESTSSINLLPSSVYTVTVSDANGCTAIAGTSITEPALLLAAGSPDQNIPCGNSVTIYSSPSGGTQPYSFQWNTGHTQSSVASVPTGVYWVSVTDANGCMAYDTVNVTSGSTDLSAAITGLIIMCYGDTSTFTAIPAGGSGNYLYLWNSGDTTASVQVPQGTWCVTVTDSSGCKVSACETTSWEQELSVSISPLSTCFGLPQTLTAIVSGGVPQFSFQWSTGETTQTVVKYPGTYAVTVTDSINCVTDTSALISEAPLLQLALSDIFHVSCKGGNDGTATVDPSGGTPPYSFLWSPVFSVGPSVYGLIPGTYYVTVTDWLGCTADTSVTITEPSSLLILDSIGGNHISCYNGSDGSVSVIASGGTPPYNYLWWNDGDTSASNSGLPAGQYTVSAGDTNGCNIILAITLTEPPPLSAVASVTNHISCNGGADGSASVQVSGGTLPYTYLWSSGDSGPSAAGLVAGSYTVTVTDANGCTASPPAAWITEPSSLVISSTVTGASCAGSTGSVIINATGGTPAYSYLWSDGKTTPIINGVSPGIYAITVTDAKGCSAALAAAVNQPDSIAVTVSGQGIICIGDSVTISALASGGTPPYTYIWDHNLGQGSVKVVSPSVTAVYSVIVIDSNNCTSQAQSVMVTTNTPLGVDLIGISSLCQGDNTVLTASGSGGDGGPYTYSWSIGMTGNSITVAPVILTTYTVTVTDGCGSPSAVDTIRINVQPQLVLNPVSVMGCPGDTFTLTVSGAVTYWWSTLQDPDDTIGLGAIVSVIPASTTYYLVHGYDGVCEASDTVTVLIASPPEADFTFYPEESTLLYPVITFSDASSPDVISWLWDFDDGSSSILPDVVHTYQDTGNFHVMLVVKNGDGCPDTILKIVRIRPEFMLFMPSAFSPNFDGKNDWLFPRYIGVDKNDFHFYVFDRWGDMIFHSDNPDEYWDGIANKGKRWAQQDVYVWLIQTRDLNGEGHTFIGHVTLIK